MKLAPILLVLAAIGASKPKPKPKLIPVWVWGTLDGVVSEPPQLINLPMMWPWDECPAGYVAVRVTKWISVAGETTPMGAPKTEWLGDSAACIPADQVPPTEVN